MSFSLGHVCCSVVCLAGLQVAHIGIDLYSTLPETNSKFAPENGCLEYFLVSFWISAYFQGLLLLVSGMGMLAVTHMDT